MVDIEKLITLVYDRKPLWDVSSKSYHNRGVARKLWREIAEELNITCEVAKAKWQNLKDYFRREHAKISKAPTGSAAVGDTQISSWKLYKQLLFLVDVFSSRTMQTNIPPVSSQTSEQAVTSNGEEDTVMESNSTVDSDLAIITNTSETQKSQFVVEAVPTDPLPGSASFKKPVMTTKRKLGKPDAIAKLLALEQRKVEQLERRCERSNTSEDLTKDEDYHFLMSLLPHLRDIPKRKKLATRMRLQQVLMNAEESEETIHCSVSLPCAYNYSPQSSTPSPNTPQPSPHDLTTYVETFSPEYLNM